MKIKTNGWLFASQKSMNFQSIWTKEKIPLKASELMNLQASPSYFQKRTKTFKRLVKRYYYIADNTLYYCEKQKSTTIKGILNLSQVYAEFYESKVKILKNNTYIICLRQDSSFVELLTENKQIFLEWSQVLRRCCIMLDFHNQFNILKMIGKGGFARVFLAQDKQSRENYAIKVITKDKLLQQSKGIKSLLNEIEILRDLDSVSGCLKLIGVYETDSSVNLILEYVKGGELVKRINRKDKHNFTIENARQLMQNILIALVNIHQRRIIHRDIKPDNILLEDDVYSNKIKIADFGLATYDSSVLNDFLFKKCGTPGFLAPEVLSNKEPYKLYDQKVDVFSTGVIFYLLLCGQQPFKGINHRQVVDQNKKCEIDFSILDSNQKIPQAAKSLVKQMLQKDPLNRPSSSECLKSLFFKENYQNNNLNLEMNSYEANKLQSLDGLNKIKISSLDRASQQSQNDLYWINPIWKGQTSTLQTVTKLSSIYLQINEVRKRNKSNFAPNTQNPQIENDDSPLISSSLKVREKRSASADCDFQNKFQNQSLHIAVLKKNKQGEEQSNTNNQPQQNDNNFVVIEEDQSEQTSIQDNLQLSEMLKNFQDKSQRKIDQTQESFPQINQENLKTSIFQKNQRQTLDIPVEEYKISFKSSGGESIESEPKINSFCNNKNIGISQNHPIFLTDSSHFKQIKMQEAKIINEDVTQRDIIEENDECRNQQISNRSGDCNLNRSEALENHCQIINQIAIRFKQQDYYVQTGRITAVPTKYINQNQDSLEESQSARYQQDQLTFSRQCRTNPSYINNSCVEADFRVSEVEENISSRQLQEAINRNLIFRYNPFHQDIYS